MSDALEVLRAKVEAATPGDWEIMTAYNGRRHYLAKRGAYGAVRHITHVSSDQVSGAANVELILTAVNLAKRLCTDEGVEEIALEIAVADAEQDRWGRAIMPLDIARVFARAAIRAIIGEQPQQGEG